MARINIKSSTEPAEELIILEPEDSPEFMEAVKEHISDAETVKPPKDDKLDPLAQIVRSKYDEVKAQRSELEQGWLNDIRQYRGIYSPDVMQKMHPKRSKAFIRLTRTKVKTVDSRQADFLLPVTGERNWSIEPTPIAEYSMDKMAQIFEVLKAQTGQEPTPAQMQLAMDNSAKESAKRMTTKIEDQLANLRYREIMKEVLHSGNLYGTGVLKGPMVSISQASRYMMDPESKAWSMQEFDELTPYIEAVSIWDIFPDLSATKADDCNFITQRHKMSKHKLMGLAGRNDFDGQKIHNYIVQNGSGDFEDQYYDTELQALGGVHSSSVDGKKES